MGRSRYTQIRRMDKHAATATSQSGNNMLPGGESAHKVQDLTLRLTAADQILKPCALHVFRDSGRYGRADLAPMFFPYFQVAHHLAKSIPTRLAKCGGFGACKLQRHPVCQAGGMRSLSHGLLEATVVALAGKSRK